MDGWMDGDTNKMHATRQHTQHTGTIYYLNT